jgi:hypothetical protein
MMTPAWLPACSAFPNQAGHRLFPAITLNW